MASAPPHSFLCFSHSLNLPQDLDEHRHGHTHPSAFTMSLDPPAHLIQHSQSSRAVPGAQELSLFQFWSLRWAPGSSLQSPRPEGPPGPLLQPGPSHIHDAVGRVGPDGVRDHLGSRLPDAIALQAGSKDRSSGWEQGEELSWGTRQSRTLGDAAQLYTSIQHPCAHPIPCRTLLQGTLRALRQPSEELEKAPVSWRG